MTVEMLMVADEYRLEELRNKCSVYLTRNVNNDNCIEVPTRSTPGVDSQSLNWLADNGGQPHDSQESVSSVAQLQVGAAILPGESNHWRRSVKTVTRPRLRMDSEGENGASPEKPARRKCWAVAAPPTSCRRLTMIGPNVRLRNS